MAPKHPASKRTKVTPFETGKFSGRGGKLRWKKGVEGTNLAATPEQEKTWFLWEFGHKFGARPGGTIVGTVRPAGRRWEAFNYNSASLGIFGKRPAALEAVVTAVQG